MFLKLIQCIVPTDHDPEFSKAQEGWKETGHSPGFIAQWGGWEFGQPRHVWILSFWESKEDLCRFMDLHHDRIQNENGQAETYTDITIQHAWLVETEPLTAIEVHRKLSGQISACILKFSIQSVGTRPNELFHFKISDSSIGNVYIQFMDRAVPKLSADVAGVLIKGVNAWQISSFAGDSLFR
ncbi:MAG: YdbC family protein [Saprospiraceae bacterium]|nr:YdbC family protein [Saprospiraceae bacterium]